MFLKRRRRKIIQGFFEISAALRKQDSGSIQLIGGLRSRKQRRVKCLFFGKLLGARSAIGQMHSNALALVLADSFANVKNQKWSNILAGSQRGRAREHSN